MGRRLSIFLPSLAGGGAERALCGIANGLAARGVETTLVLAVASGPYLGLLHDDVRLVDLKAASTLHALPRLAGHLRRSRPDALLAAMSHANIVAALAHRLSGSRAQLVLSERVNLSSVFGAYRDWRTRCTRALMHLTYPWADRVIAVSEGVAEDLRRHIKLPAQRVLSIYNPVVDDHLQAQADAPPSHPWLSAGDRPVVLAAGRLIEQKGFDTLIDAFARLRRQRPVRLLILGEGELRGALLAQVASLGLTADVDLPGFATNPFAEMRAASVFVLSSRFEGLPGVLIQAMACGTRVVSTDCPSGPHEVLQGGRWGTLVPVDDADALAAAMAAALDDPHPPDVRARAASFTPAPAVDAYARVLGLG